MAFNDNLLATLDDAIRAELAGAAPELLREFPVERAAAGFDALPRLAPYHAVPQDVAANSAAIQARHGVAVLEGFNRLLALHFIRRGTLASSIGLGDELAALREAELERIATDIERPRKGFHRLDRDPFAKDLAVCRGVLLPGGVELFAPAAGIGRRIVFEAGIAAAAPRLGFFLGRMGGFKPFCELHFDRRRIGEFNADGYAALYRRVAALLGCNPGIGGVVSSSWWHDPALREISPELGFIDAIPRAAGARVLRTRENEVATADALRFSPQRSARFAAGTWRPCVHLLAWPRRDVLSWARSFA